MNVLDNLKFDSNGLVAVVVQDHLSDEVLMVGYMNEAAVQQTLATGKVTYWSRSRRKFWIKGETSGHFQHLKSLRVDCDQDCLLAIVEQVGPACHNGYRSCFYREIESETNTLNVIAERQMTREEIYGS